MHRNPAETTEFDRLTRAAVRKLIAGRTGGAVPHDHHERRRAPRWPFMGTVEIWVSEGGQPQRYILGTCRNLSEEGVGIMCDEELACGLKIDIAVHEPEATLTGRAVVRHCAAAHDDYYCGLQFEFTE